MGEDFVRINGEIRYLWRAVEYEGETLEVFETRSRKGAFVRVLSTKELIDLFEVSAELEGLACRLASERLTDQTAPAIQAGLDACSTAAEQDDVQSYAAANLQFHGAIHAASGNAWLIEQLGQIQTRINPYRSMPYQIRGRLPMIGVTEGPAQRLDEMIARQATVAAA